MRRKADTGMIGATKVCGYKAMEESDGYKPEDSRVFRADGTGRVGALLRKKLPVRVAAELVAVRRNALGRAQKLQYEMTRCAHFSHGQALKGTMSPPSSSPGGPSRAAWARRTKALAPSKGQDILEHAGR